MRVCDRVQYETCSDLNIRPTFPRRSDLLAYEDSCKWHPLSSAVSMQWTYEAGQTNSLNHPYRLS